MIEIILIVAVIILAVLLVCCYRNKRLTTDEKKLQRKQQAAEIREAWDVLEAKVKNFNGSVYASNDFQFSFFFFGRNDKLIITHSNREEY